VYGLTQFTFALLFRLNLCLQLLLARDFGLNLLLSVCDVLRQRFVLVLTARALVLELRTSIVSKKSKVSHSKWNANRDKSAYLRLFLAHQLLTRCAFLLGFLLTRFGQSFEFHSLFLAFRFLALGVVFGALQNCGQLKPLFAHTTQTL
jgi:hypothetical protein